jgi:hypothetical protein
MVNGMIPQVSSPMTTVFNAIPRAVAPGIASFVPAVSGCCRRAN